jgi:hypothetical protein
VVGAIDIKNLDGRPTQKTPRKLTNEMKQTTGENNETKGRV